MEAGRIGLWHTILGFDPQRGTAFSTYAWTCIMHRVWREVKLAERVQGQTAGHLPLTEAASCVDEDRDPARDWEAFTAHCTLWYLIARLPYRLRIVVLARDELTGQPQVFYAQIGAGLGVSGERARRCGHELDIGIGVWTTGSTKGVPGVVQGFGRRKAQRGLQMVLLFALVDAQTTFEFIHRNDLIHLTTGDCHVEGCI